MKIYIAGPITGHLGYRARVCNTAADIAASGNVPLSPAILPNGMVYEDYMRICFSMIDCADKVLFLRGREQSSGARREQNYAAAIGKVVEYE